MLNRKSPPWLALLLSLALWSCANPPPSAYDTGASGPAAGTAIGTNTAGESCTSQPNGGGVDVYCGAWNQPSAQVRNGGPADAGQLAALATTSPWRASLDAAYACGAPAPGTILDGQPAEVLSCTQRLGGWPHVAMVSIIGGTAYYADGVLPALPPMQRAIGLLSGKSAAAIGSAPVATSNAELAQRLATEAYSSGDIGQYNNLMDVGSQANQAEDFSSAVIAYRAALALQQDKIGVNNPGTVAPMLELALNLSDQGEYPEAASLFATAAALAPAATDPTANAKLLHYEGLDQLNQGHDAAALAYMRQAEAASATNPDRVICWRRRPASTARSPKAPCSASSRRCVTRPSRCATSVSRGPAPPRSNNPMRSRMPTISTRRSSAPGSTAPAPRSTPPAAWTVPPPPG
jgi:tetratricopeptide (TPR) repeat protein